MFNLYPYTDFHEINLDWIIRKIKELGQAFNDFEAVNKITNAGAWDITKQYQAWTVVSDNNMGYISLKPVPAGVAITNTFYWGLIADYDILITDLSSRISALETKLTDNYIFIGDSYTAGTIGSKWYDTVKSCLGLTEGTNTRLSAQDGAGFVNSGFSNLLAAVSVDNPDAITKIVVCGGMNDDTSSEAAILTAIESFMNQVKNAYPNASVYIGSIGWRTSVTGNAQELTVINAYKKCVNYGARYLNGVEWAMHRYDYFHSGYPNHPNADGNASIGRAITNALLTGSYDPTSERRELTITMNVNPAAQSIGNTHVLTQISGGCAELVFSSYAGRQFSFTVDADVTVTPNAPLALFTLPSDTYFKGFANDYSTVLGYIRDNINYNVILVRLMLLNDTLYLAPLSNYAITTAGTYTINCFRMTAPLGDC